MDPTIPTSTPYSPSTPSAPQLNNVNHPKITGMETDRPRRDNGLRPGTDDGVPDDIFSSSGDLVTCRLSRKYVTNYWWTCSHGLTTGNRAVLAKLERLP
jgi:hypothetical protein